MPPRKWPPKGPGQQNSSRSMAIWILVIIVFFLAFLFYNSSQKKEYKISYSQFINEIEKSNISSVKIKEQEVHGILKKQVMIPTEDGQEIAIRNFKVILPATDKDLPDKIWKNNPHASVEGELPGSNIWMKALATALPLIALLALWMILMRQMQAGGNKAFSFGKSKAKLMGGNMPQVTFDDVAGTEEAKEELQEVIEFLRDPKKFQKLGGRIPKGVILLGPPGTGKTLLARAVAGEAAVPFFSMSGSDFVEMFVGVGASRVRDMFEKGKKHAPCILFIDELDAVGRHRGAGLGGGHDEREQTLNQLLVEMDGFESNEGVILLAATNRPDVLDPALLRPGRFDRRIIVDMPDKKGRLGILKVHTRKIPLDGGVDLEVLARGTPGMSGADLANMVNEAALLAARYNKEKVEMEDFDEAKDKVLLGPERKSRIMKEDIRRMTAYHEAGHTVVGSYLEHADPLHKVTIIPRGRAEGLTSFLPEDDRREYSREWCLDFVTLSLGGRAAEELVLHRISSGAQNDIKNSSKLVRRMVTQWGMSERLGPIAYGDRDEQVFLGKEIAVQKDYSERTAQLIDEEVNSIVTECSNKAKQILEDHKDQLHIVANTLLERESLTSEDIKILLNGGELPPVIGKKPEAGAEGAGDSAAEKPGEEARTEQVEKTAPGKEGQDHEAARDDKSILKPESSLDNSGEKSSSPEGKEPEKKNLRSGTPQEEEGNRAREDSGDNGSG